MQPWADMMDGQGEGKGDSVFRFLGEEDSGRAPTFSWVALCGLGQPLHTFLSSPGLIDGIDSQYQLPDMGRREASVSSLLPESGWDALAVPLWGPWRARARGQEVGETRPTGPLASFSHSPRPDRRPTCQGHGQPLWWGVVLSESNASHRDTEGAISLANSVMAVPLPTVPSQCGLGRNLCPQNKTRKGRDRKKAVLREGPFMGTMPKCIWAAGRKGAGLSWLLSPSSGQQGVRPAPSTLTFLQTGWGLSGPPWCSEAEPLSRHLPKRHNLQADYSRAVGWWRAWGHFPSGFTASPVTSKSRSFLGSTWLGEREVYPRII